MPLILVPFDQSMRLGQGYNTYLQQVCMENAVTFAEVPTSTFATAPKPLFIDPNPSPTAGQSTTGGDGSNEPALKDTPSTPETADMQAIAKNVQLYPVEPNSIVPQVVDYKTTVTNKVSDALENLNISAAASVKMGTVTASGSGAFVQEDKVKSSSLTYILTVKVMNEVAKPDTSSLTVNRLDEVYKYKELFLNAYGDGFISGFVKGGEFNAIVSIVTKDEAHTEDIKADLSIGMSAFSGTGHGGFSSASSNAMSEVNYAVNWRGGGQIKHPQQPWNMASLFQAATEFPARVSACPEYCYAIITKWDHVQDFHKKIPPEWWNASLIDYDMASTYTNDLLDQFLEYKTMLKQMSDIANNIPGYQQSSAVDAISLNIPSVVQAKKEIKKQMALIAQEVDYVTFDPHRAIDASLGLTDSNKPPPAQTPSVASLPDPATGDKPPVLRSPPPPLPDIIDPQLFTARMPIPKNSPASSTSIMAGSPKAYRTTSGLTEIFCAGADGLIYRKWIDGSQPGLQSSSTTGSWEVFDSKNNITVDTQQEIAAVYRGDSSVDLRDLFVLGADRKLWRKMYTGGAWQPWQKVNDFLYASGPSVVHTGRDRVDIAIRTTDGQVHWFVWTQGTYTGPMIFSGSWYAQPCLINFNPGDGTKDGSTLLYCITQGQDFSSMFRFTLSDGGDAAKDGGFQVSQPLPLQEGNTNCYPMAAFTMPTDKTIAMLAWTGPGDMETWAAQHVWGQPYGSPYPTSRINLENRMMLSAPAVAITDNAFFVFSVRGTDVVPGGMGKLVCHTTDLSFDLGKLGSGNANATYVISQQIYNNPCAVSYDKQVDVFACGLGGILWRRHFDGVEWSSVEEMV